VAGIAITAADPSGLWGLLKEAMAGGWALVEAKQNAGANPLVKAVADDISTPETRTAAKDRMQSQFAGSQLGQIWLKAVKELRGIAALVDSKAPEDAPGSRLGWAWWLRMRPRQATRAAFSALGVWQ
jgi:hypothetical protein